MSAQLETRQAWWFSKQRSSLIPHDCLQSDSEPSNQRWNLQSQTWNDWMKKAMILNHKSKAMNVNKCSSSSSVSLVNAVMNDKQAMETCLQQVVAFCQTLKCVGCHHWGTVLGFPAHQIDAWGFPCSFSAFCCWLINCLEVKQTCFDRIFCDKWCCSVFQKMVFTQRMDCFGAAWWASGRHDSPRLWKFCSHWAGHCKFDAFIEKSLKMNAMCKEKKTPSFTMWANKQHKNSNRIKAFWCLDILVSSRSQHSVTTQVLVEKHQFGSNIMVVKRVTMWIAMLLLERNLLQIVLV